MKINFRKWLCRNLNQDTWLYKACDCHRDEPKPQPPTPPPPPAPPAPPLPTKQERVRAAGRLFGASIYHLILQPMNLIEWFLQQLQAAGATASEMFFIFTWGKDPSQFWRGWCYVPLMTTGVTTDIGLTIPVWALTDWSEQLAQKWLDVFRLFAKYKIVLVLKILDNCSIKNRIAKRYLPYSGAHRDRDKYTGGMFGWSWTGEYYPKDGSPWEGQKIGKYNIGKDGHIGPYYAFMLEKLVGLLRASGVEYRLVPMNECDYPGFAQKTCGPGERDMAIFQFHSWFKMKLVAHGVPPENLLASVSSGRRLVSSLDYQQEIHGINSPQALTEAQVYIKEPFSPNGDGGDRNAQGRKGDNNYREPSVIQGGQMGRLLRMYKRDYLYLLRTGRLDTDPTYGLQQIQESGEDFLDVLKALVDGYLGD